MMTGKPIIFAVNSGNDPVTEENCGLMMPPGNVEAVIQAILYLTQLSQRERTIMGQNGKKFVLENQTYSVLVKYFLDGISYAYSMERYT